MPIEIRASESVGPLGEVAYASGLGAFRQSQQERADRNRQFNQQMQLQQAQLASQHELGLKQLDVTRENQQDYLSTLKEMESQREGARLDSMQKDWELKEKSADRDIQRRMNAARMQMSVADQREMSKLQNAKRWIRSNPGLTDKQKATMLDRVNARIYGILPEDLPAQGQSVQDVVKERVWQNEKGETFILGPDGKIDYRPPNKIKDELPPMDADFKQNVMPDANGNIWVRDRDGNIKLALERKNTNAVVPIAQDYAENVFYDANGNAWVRDANNTLKVALQKQPTPSNVPISEDFKNKVYPDDKGNLWTRDSNGNIKLAIKNEPTPANKPITDVIKQNVTTDSQGNVWVMDNKGNVKLAAQPTQPDKTAALSKLSAMYSNFVRSYGDMPPSPDEMQKAFTQTFMPMLEELSKPPTYQEENPAAQSQPYQWGDTGTGANVPPMDFSWINQPGFQPAPTPTPQAQPAPSPTPTPEQGIPPEAQQQRIPGLSPATVGALSRMTPEEQAQVDAEAAKLVAEFEDAVQRRDHQKEAEVRRKMQALYESRLGG